MSSRYQLSWVLSCGWVLFAVEACGEPSTASQQSTSPDGALDDALEASVGESSSTCSPSVCDGCCDLTGVCRLGLMDATCGKGGVSCVDCRSSAKACMQGACQIPSDAGPDAHTDATMDVSAPTDAAADTGAETDALDDHPHDATTVDGACLLCNGHCVSSCMTECIPPLVPEYLSYECQGTCVGFDDLGCCPCPPNQQRCRIGYAYSCVSDCLTECTGSPDTCSWGYCESAGGCPTHDNCAKCNDTEAMCDQSHSCVNACSECSQAPFRCASEQNALTSAFYCRADIWDCNWLYVTDQRVRCPDGTLVDECGSCAVAGSLYSCSLSKVCVSDCASCSNEGRPETTLCGDVCVDLQTEFLHCGTCSVTCERQVPPYYSTCTGGVCL
jgi:hypothetical protein